MGKTARSIATGVPRAAEGKAAAVPWGSTLAGRDRVVHKASVVHAPVVARILVGIAIKLERVLRVAAVDVTRPNLKVAEACWHDSRAAKLIAEGDRNVVGRSVPKTR